jgi:hypothetical protein
MAQKVKCLLQKCEALSSNPSSTTTSKKSTNGHEGMFNILSYEGNANKKLH